ncbi:hypothetical protein GR160_02915 [Flavobacterium sp. Sd200]|uniref:hypothetical protein n=1 Tax=Flavobacterium sp. Sd200 TaxID=2692211 RepID=UPI00136941D7|nr:hypothetical protein [Flavobacterium sp. Sd200]MXN90165.1 hypothetical protein [Flavobacterium sp. Sd200]
MFHVGDIVTLEGEETLYIIIARRENYTGQFVYDLGTLYHPKNYPLYNQLERDLRPYPNV